MLRISFLLPTLAAIWTAPDLASAQPLDSTEQTSPIARHLGPASLDTRGKQQPVTGPFLDCNRNGLPDACDVDCGSGGASCNAATCGRSADCNGNGKPDECELGDRVRLTASDAAFRAEFGRAVAIDGDVAIVGARNDCCHSDGQSSRGAAYIYRFDGANWVEETKLTPPESDNTSSFGGSVAISGNRAVVFASSFGCEADPLCNAAYVYRFDPGTPGKWSVEARLASSDTSGLDNFSGAIAISGDNISLGAFSAACASGESCGAVYVYRFDADAPAKWIEEAKLTASDAAAGAGFGGSVAMTADTVIVGAPEVSCPAGISCGAAYVFRRSPDPVAIWAEETRLTSLVETEAARFGTSVAIDGNVTIVGANLEPCIEGEHCGAAYVFRFEPGTPGSWSQEARLTSPEGTAENLFGTSAAISSDTAIITTLTDCEFDDPQNAFCGSAYVYAFDPGAAAPWVAKAKLKASSGPQLEYFSGAVAIDGNKAIIGSWHANSPSCYSCGAAHVIDVTGFDCNFNGAPDDCDVAGGTSVDLNADQIPDECGPCVSDADCGDGVFCNGMELCDSINDCLIGATPCALNDLCDEQSDSCVPDCNRNGVADRCDVACDAGCHMDACGTSDDCGGNAVPDECEFGLQSEVIAFDASFDDEFGDSIALDGNIAVFGAPGDKHPHSQFLEAGAAYVYRFDPGAPGGWTREAKLRVSDVFTFRFGRSVAISGDTIVVGAQASFHPFDATHVENTIYIYRFEGAGWFEEARLTPFGEASTNFFSESTVAISGDTVAVLLRRSECEAGASCNAVFVYRRRADAPELWTLEAELTVTDPSNGIVFTGSIAISHDTLVVAGADQGHGMAIVYRFVPGTPGIWVEEAKLTGVDSGASNFFERSVGISGDVIVVSDPRLRCPSGRDCGAVFIFRFDPSSSPPWVQEAKLIPPPEVWIRPFRGTVAIHGDTIVAVVGEGGCSATAIGCGGASVYRYVPTDPNRWIEIARLSHPSGPLAHEGFAESIAVHENRALVGAPDRHSFGNISEVFEYAIGSIDCNESGIDDDCEVVDPGDFDANGIVDMDDWKSFTECMGGPGNPDSPARTGCSSLCRTAFDVDADGVVSLKDAAEMLNLLSNP